MNLSKLLAQLRKERDQIDEEIFGLERLARGPHRRHRSTTGRGGSGNAGGNRGGGSGNPLASYPRPLLEDCPTRKRNTPRNPDLKTDAA
jgi:hypothetical protein